jgi:hypothetical protein
LTEAELIELRELEMEEWRERWTSELFELLTRIPPGVQSQVVQFKNVKIGIQVMDKCN